MRESCRRSIRNFCLVLVVLFLHGFTFAGERPPELIALIEHCERWRSERYVDWGASIEAFDRHAATLEEMLETLATIDRDALDPADRDELDVLHAMLDDSAGYFRYECLMPLTSRRGLHRRMSETGTNPARWTVETLRDYAHELEKLSGMIQTTVVLMQRGLARGWTPPRDFVADVPSRFQVFLDEDLARFEWPFGAVMQSGASEEFEALWRIYSRTTKPAIVAEIRGLLFFMENVYLPQCRETIALTDLPGGREWYDHELRTVVETDCSPEELHELGLSEVRRIEREMMTLIRRTEFAADASRVETPTDRELFELYNEHLRSSPRFRFESTDRVIDAYCRVAKSVDGWLPYVSGEMPRLPYGIYPSPPSIDTIGPVEYRTGSLRDRMPSVLFVNARSVDHHRTFEVIPLVLHETIPGHHLQLAIAQELEDLPIFRRDRFAYALGEGWALYAEFLGVEMGFYRTTEDKLGRLSSEMHRACRLVVDPAICVLGWTREQAVEFMIEKTPLAEDRVRAEIERFVTTPGQACTYKIGELRIRALRDESERRLGEAFDLRAFHDVLLGAGSVPLDVAERRVRAWLDDSVARPNTE